MQTDLKNILESLLFVSEEPLTIKKFKTILDSVDGSELRNALEQLQQDYEQRAGGFVLHEVAGGWQLRSRPQYHEWIKRLLQPSPQRLSKAALETLAIIAYKQPIIRADIEHVRGVDCGGVLRQLMERKLVRILGRKEIPGRPIIYATTKLFLELFDLKDLKDLPSPRQLAELEPELENEQTSDSQQTQLPRQETETDGTLKDPIQIPETPETMDSDSKQDHTVRPDEIEKEPETQLLIQHIESKAAPKDPIQIPETPETVDSDSKQDHTVRPDEIEKEPETQLPIRHIESKAAPKDPIQIPETPETVDSDSKQDHTVRPNKKV
ncbi:MAG: SMC-Scp complex subunit ScpB [Desulfobacteraceae bacterium]|nr:SMC-Scp complex subunit ScpB [Desulfobacteraceae bacterium]